MSDTDKLVIQVKDGHTVNYPVTYTNFLLLFPDCPVQDTPTNDVIGVYGYEVFVTTLMPQYTPGPYIKNEDGNWTNSWVLINT